jgi:hypothetical protein
MSMKSRAFSAIADFEITTAQYADGEYDERKCVGHHLFAVPVRTCSVDVSLLASLPLPEKT